MTKQETQAISVREINSDLWWQFRLLSFKRKVNVRVILEEAIREKLEHEKGEHDGK